MSEPTGAHDAWTDERGVPATSEEWRRLVPGAPQAGGRHRDELLDAIREHAETWADAGIRSEEIRALPARRPGVVLAENPAELGATPLAPLEFCDVIEELAWSRDMTSIATRTARFPGGAAVSERAVFHKVRGELRNGGPLPPRARR